MPHPPTSESYGDKAVEPLSEERMRELIEAQMQLEQREPRLSVEHQECPSGLPTG